MPTAVLRRDKITWLAYGQLAAFGYFFYGFGPVIPLLVDEQQISRGVAGLHGTAFAVGSLTGGMALPPLVRRFGRERVAWGAVVVFALATLGFWAAHPLWATLPLAAVAAFGGTTIVSTGLAALADHHGDAGPAAMSEGNAVAAAVGLLGPIGVGLTLSAGLGWRPGLAIAVGLLALLAAAAFAFRVRIPTARPVPDSATAGRLPRSYWLVWVCIVALASVELCFNLWVADVLRTHSRAPAGIATASVSVIVAGMVVGRLVAGRLVLRFAPAGVLLVAIGVSILGFAVFWLAPTAWLAVAGLVVLGLGNGVHFPLGMALAVANSGGQPDLAMSRGTYALSLAGGASPFLLGVIADRVGPHTAFLIVPAFLLAAMAIAWRLWNRADRPAPAAAVDEVTAALPGGASVRP